MNKILSILILLALLPIVSMAYPIQYTLVNSNCEVTGGSVIMQSSVPSTYTIVQETPDNEVSSSDMLTWTTYPDFSTQGANNYYLIDAYPINYFPYHAAFRSDVSGCLDVGLNFIPIGASATWNKNTYTQGETATITVSFNSQYFNKTKYNYEFSILDPVTGYADYYTITSPSMQIKYTLTNQGTYETSFSVTDKSAPDQGLLILHTYAFVTNSELLSFVTWQPHDYIVGMEGKLSYGVSNSFMDNIYNYKIDIYKDNILIYTYDNLPNMNVLYYEFNQPGTYTAKLVRYTLFDEILKTDSAKVTLPPSNIDSSKSVYNTSETITLSGVKYPEINEKGYYYVVVSHFQSLDTVRTDKVTGVRPYIFSLDYSLPIGRYTGSLYGTLSLNDCAIVDSPTQCYRLKDYVNFDVVAPTNQSTGKPDLSIAWKEPQYKLWDSASFSYQNTTVSDKVIIYDNLGVVKTQFMTKDRPYSSTVQIDSDPKYLGNWSAKIIDSSNSNNFKIATMQVISASQQNFSNQYGITMNWDAPIGTPGRHKLQYNTGTYTGTYNLKLVDGSSGLFILTLPFEASNVHAQEYTFTLDGKYPSYTVQFIGSNGTILAASSIDISKATGVPGVTTPGQPTDSMTADQAGTEVTGLLSSKIFWAFLMTFGSMIAVSIEVRRSGADAFIPSIAIGFFGVLVFSVIGWIPLWIGFALVLFILVAYAWKQVEIL